MNTIVGRWLLLQGTTDQNAIRNATVQNTYGIGRIDLKTASLLWTTTEPLTLAVGSGDTRHKFSLDTLNRIIYGCGTIRDNQVHTPYNQVHDVIL